MFLAVIDCVYYDAHTTLTGMEMKLINRISLASVFTFAVCIPALQAEQWHQFRGPSGLGHTSVTNLPMHWSDDAGNLAWKAPIDGLGWSSPIVEGDRIWVTTATDEGLSLRVVCLELKTGQEIHNVELFRRERALRIHRKNSHASPTPIIVGDRIFVHFGTYGTACLTLDGKIVWRKSIDYNHVHGPGGSPVVFEDLLIFSCDGGKQQFVIAIDCKDGTEKWRTDRPENDFGKKFAFSTPLLIDVESKPQVISAGAGSVVAYDPRNGRQIWYAKYPGGYSVVPRPVYANGLLFVSSSYDRPRLMAIRPDGM